MAHPAILCLLATLSLLSGCLSEGPSEVNGPAAPAPTGDSATAVPAEAGSVPAPQPAPLPECPDNHSNNYGISFNIVGHYIESQGAGSGRLAIYYQESNGCSGLQTEESWPHNPDTKIVEVPFPLLDEIAPSAKA
jgi:hypothetical protein